jgi:glycosyltransferase involved in cell wall biosynthesis
MYRGRKIALVIPAHNEEKLIGQTLACVPRLVDKTYVVDDASTDRTRDIVTSYLDSGRSIELLCHDKNQGPGGAIITGYKCALADGSDIVAVIGGDNQMPLDQLTCFLDPLIDGRADYAKGNRFMRRQYSIADIPTVMPKTRLIGNAIITALTKMASGYYKVADVVDGYTAITRESLQLIDWDQAWRGYGYPMDFLIRLNAYGLRVKDVERRAIYAPGERQSQIKGIRYAMRVSPMLVRGFFWRLWNKYVMWNFHPLVFFYFAGIALVALGFLMGVWLIYQQISGAGVSGPKAILDALMIITGTQFLLFAMLFDMQESLDLMPMDRRSSDRAPRRRESDEQ